MDKFKDLLSLDVETSGPSPFENSLMSIGAIPFGGEEFSITVNIKERNILWGEVALGYFNQYRKDWESSCVSPEEGYDRFNNYLVGISKELKVKQFLLVGQNIQFDMSFLKRLCFLVKKPFFENISHQAIDTHSLMKGLVLSGKLNLKDLSSKSAFQYFNIALDERDAHVAINDARATLRLLKNILNYA